MLFQSRSIPDEAAHYERFVAGLDDVCASYRAVECAFGRAPFGLLGGVNTLQVKGHDLAAINSGIFRARDRS
jgi:hypothetical protein